MFQQLVQLAQTLQTNTCQAGTVEHLEKPKMATKLAATIAENRKFHRSFCYHSVWSEVKLFRFFKGQEPQI